MRMDKGAIFASMAIIALASVLVGAGTMAYFSSTKTAGPNVIVAGTMDLALTCSFELKDIFPSKKLDPITVFFQNKGSIPGYLYYKVTYTQKDNAPNVVDLNADDFAALIYVEKVTYQHWGIYDGVWGWGQLNEAGELAKWLAMDSTSSGGNGDGKVSLYEIKRLGWLPYETPQAPLIPGEAGRWVITFHMADSLTSWPAGQLLFDVEDNRPQDDGIDVTFTAVLRSSAISP